MFKGYFLFLFSFISHLIIWSQEILVYQDNFSNATSNTSGPHTGSANGLAPNTTKWHYTETDGGWSVAHQFASSQMQLINNYNTDDSYGTAFLNKRLGGSLSPIGSDGVYGTYQTSNPNYIKDDFTNNTQNLEWTFLFYISHSSNMGLSNGGTYYGGAFILGSEYNNITMCSTSLRNKGYAVVFASGNIQLVRFTSGSSNACATNNYSQYLLNNTFSNNSNSCLVSDNSNTLVGGRWYAVKVQYNPSNDQWRLFTRHNVTASFDPTTLVSADGRGAAVDNTYTSNSLTYMGLYASLPPENNTYGIRSVRIKSLKIKKNTTLISTPAGSGACAGILALPVELSYFVGEKLEDQNSLMWLTHSEQNNSHFEIQISLNGNEFRTVGELQGKGTTNETSYYSFLHDNPPREAYYRLKQFDYDGKIKYSPILFLQNISQGNFEIYPQPAGDFIKVNFETKKSKTELLIFDISGIIVLRESMEPDQIEHIIHLNTIRQGSYILELRNQNFIARKQFIKL